MKYKNSTKKGFTLIELLVVIAIIGILSSAVLASLNSARTKARISSAQAQLKEINKAIAFLIDDTGLYPSKVSDACTNGDEIWLDIPAAGIESTDGNFPGWSGPYLNIVPLDPWGTNYLFDGDYRCGATTMGCGGVADLGTDSAVIQSYGPNKTQNYGNGDDIVIVLCKR